MSSRASSSGAAAILADHRVRVVLLTIFVTMVGFGIMSPILPLFAQSFGVGYGAVGVLIASFAFMRLAFDLVAGPLVDRYGERLMASVGVAFVGLSTIFVALAPTFTLAVLFRGAGGAGSAVLFAALYSYFLKVVPREQTGRAFGLFYGMFNIGLIAGQPVGGFLAHATHSYTVPLYAYAGTCFLSGGLFLVFTRRLPDRRDPPQLSREEALAERDLPILRRATRKIGRATGSQELRELFRIRAFVTANLANFAGFVVIGGVWSTLVPLFGSNGLGMSAVGIGLALSVAIAAEFLVLYPFGAVADRHGRKPLLVASLAGYAVAVAAVGWAAGALELTVLLALMGIASGAGATAPTAMLSDVAPADGSGTAVAAFRFFGDLGFVVGPLLGGWSAGAFGFRTAFALSAVPLLFALAAAVRTRETFRGRRGTPAEVLAG